MTFRPPIKGSDHCPVYIDLKNSITTDSGETLLLRGQLMMLPVGTKKGLLAFVRSIGRSVRKNKPYCPPSSRGNRPLYQALLFPNRALNPRVNLIQWAYLAIRSRPSLPLA
jgi:hypothetical protein